MTENETSYPPILESAQEWEEGGRRYRLRFAGNIWIVEAYEPIVSEWRFEYWPTRREVACFWRCAWDDEIVRLACAGRKIFEDEREYRQAIKNAVAWKQWEKEQ